MSYNYDSLQGLLSFGACAWSFLGLSAFGLFGVFASSFSALSAFGLFGVFASSFSALSTWFSCASPVFTVPPVTQHKSCQVSYIMSHGNDRIEYMENIKRNVILLATIMTHYSAYWFLPPLCARFSTILLHFCVNHRFSQQVL